MSENLYGLLLTNTHTKESAIYSDFRGLVVFETEKAALEFGESQYGRDNPRVKYRAVIVGREI